MVKISLDDREKSKIEKRLLWSGFRAEL